MSALGPVRIPGVIKRLYAGISRRVRVSGTVYIMIQTQYGLVFFLDTPTSRQHLHKLTQGRGSTVILTAFQNICDN